MVVNSNKKNTGKLADIGPTHVRLHNVTIECFSTKSQLVLL